ncbi:hypothetical protein BJ166DRAFT_595430 [Pestalotiopsis sp. NC0098]|nr:hypothetical protein BJ166DRAFT_595430 [Pestalotiopsis sp. NC0098]
MPIPEYFDRGPVRVTSNIDLNNLVNKSVIVTGGASGLGLAYTKAFIDAGFAFVTIGDFDARAGQEAEARFAPNVKFVKCDVRDWDEQVAVFEAASSASPCKSVDIVIANAGIIRADDFNTLQGQNTPRLA